LNSWTRFFSGAAGTGGPSARTGASLIHWGVFIPQFENVAFLRISSGIFPAADHVGKVFRFVLAIS
jgi:hypothetical protein